jgi:predicted nucleic acid-binding protein
VSNLVLDCSITAAWFFEDEFTPHSEKIRQLMLQKDTTAMVPAIWSSEISNVLIQAERRKRITSEKVNQALQVLSQLPIEIDYLPIGNMGHVMLLCRKHKLTSYDATYLELAIRKNAGLATQDKKLFQAAKNESATLAGTRGSE